MVLTDLNGNAIATPNLESVSYAAYISFDLFNGGLRINAPLVFSRDLKESVPTTTKLGIGEQINFTIDLIKLIPHDLVREFKCKQYETKDLKKEMEGVLRQLNSTSRQQRSKHGLRKLPAGAR